MSHYPMYENDSGWNKLLPARAPVSLGDNLADHYPYVVVGAGYTGVAAARRLAELNPGRSILLCEAGVVGSGSSARNSGFMISEPHVSRDGEDVTLFRSRTHKHLRLYMAGLKALEALVGKYAIDCDWKAVGKYHAAATAHGVHHLKEYLESFQDWGVVCRELGPDELKQALGTAYYRYGYWTSHNVLIQPAALIRGLARHLPDSVTLSEVTPVSKIESAPGGVKIQLGHKTVHAQTVLLATNGFLKELGFLRDRLVTIYTYAGLTPELSPEDISKIGEVQDWGILPAHRLGTTLRRIGSKRLLIRTAYSYERGDPLPEVAKVLRESYLHRYPQVSQHKFEYVWGGATALTRNGAFYLGQPAQNVYAAVGCNGVGILKGTIYGQLMAEMAMGSQSELLTDALSLAKPSWLPPEPLRTVAIRSAIRYERWRAGLEM